VLWENNEYLPEVSSPVAGNGLVYIATTYGVFVCYDAKTGEKYWEHETEEGFYSSPIIADGKVYITDLSGVTHIYREGKEKQIIAEPTVGEKVFATPAFDDCKIYIKGHEYLYCIGNK
jgi:outer membrane protein assembly factor BamB